jgi:hypothetical protein
VRESGALVRERVNTAASYFSAKQYSIVKNTPGKWVQQPWHPPFAVPSDLRYANAFDTPRFELPFKKAFDLGWEATIALLANRAKQVIREIDELVRVPD